MKVCRVFLPTACTPTCHWLMEFNVFFIWREARCNCNFKYTNEIFATKWMNERARQCENHLNEMYETFFVVKLFDQSESFEFSISLHLFCLMVYFPFVILYHSINVQFCELVDNDNRRNVQKPYSVTNSEH